MILRAKDIHKTFEEPTKVEVLSGISLEVESGQTIAITGKSGEGKSTLLHILGTLEKPTRGELEICGKDVASHPLHQIRNEHIGFIFQTFNLLDDYTVIENVLMPAKIARKPTGEDSAAFKRALGLLDEVGLSSRAFFPAKVLSGGEKQRAAIARALCNDPELILADEPSGNLDHSHSVGIHELLIGSAKKWEKSLVIVTHDKELASLCNRTYLLMDGKLQCIS